ncbi:MAG: fatty acid desaturase [Actinomycetota bacterium]|nr:fatty acid desaturase [Actinomycetota bacterium]
MNEDSVVVEVETRSEQVGTLDPPVSPQPRQLPGFWRDALAAYAQPRPLRSAAEVMTSVGAYLAVSVGIYFALGVSALLALALAPVSAAFLLRTYIIFHDCSHGSFLSSRRGNAWLGAVCGFLVLTPFVRWRHDHAVHHATSGDLDRRGVGDLPTLTVEEYYARSRRGRLGYRAFRNPAVMFGLGPVFAMIIGPRIVSRNARPRMRKSVLWTDAALVAVVGSLCWLLGVGDFLITWAPGALLAGSAGIWLFYVQHQFEDAYWQRADSWSYADAALRGSSFLKLAKPLQFCTGNIGFHHIHHLSTKIPNYNLPRAHAENPVFHSVPTLSLSDGLRAVRLKLWDEPSGRLVTFSQAQACRG